MSTDPKLSAQEERLLDLALGREAHSKVDLAHSSEAAEAAELRAFLLQTRTSLSEFDAMDPARLSAAREALQQACTERAATPARSSQVHSLAEAYSGFKARLKENLALRIAAASLLLHLTALPVLAWFVFVTPERAPLNLHWEPPVEVLTEEPGEEVLRDIPMEELVESEELDAEFDSTEEEIEDVLESGDL
jgi:hypothetical protein